MKWRSYNTRVTNPAGVVPETTVPTIPTSTPRLLLNSAIFAGTLMLSCVVIGRLLPFPEVPTVSDKLEHLERHGAEYDALFIGSSRVQFQIIPALFDRTAAGHGLAVRSFNAGISAMVPPEDGYFIDQILQRPHSRLRWAFIEISPVSAQSDQTLAGTRRDTTGAIGSARCCWKSASGRTARACALPLQRIPQRPGGIERRLMASC